MATPATMSRRQFLRADFRAERSALRPPWALPEARFVGVCTRCGDCVRVCPQSILRLASSGFPEINFERGACTFCAACSAACTIGALPRVADDAAPWNLKAEIGPSCLAQHGVLCTVCREQCAAGAITLQRAPARVPVPRANTGACTGCGACYAPCPAQAIRLSPFTLTAAHLREETVCT
jgi:ferredoxin-type protein NapF